MPEENRKKEEAYSSLRGEDTLTNSSLGRRQLISRNKLPEDGDSTGEDEDVREGPTFAKDIQDRAHTETRETRVRSASRRDSSRISRMSGPGGEVLHSRSHMSVPSGVTMEREGESGMRLLCE